MRLKYLQTESLQSIEGFQCAEHPIPRLRVRRDFRHEKGFTYYVLVFLLSPPAVLREGLSTTLVRGVSSVLLRTGGDVRYLLYVLTVFCPSVPGGRSGS